MTELWLIRHGQTDWNLTGRRLGIVEPVFANICVQKRMHRFTLRTKRKLDVQWGSFALVHNISKIHTIVALI